MLTIREDREFVRGFGCGYEIIMRRWLLFGFVPLWQVREVRR